MKLLQSWLNITISTNVSFIVGLTSIWVWSFTERTNQTDAPTFCFVSMSQDTTGNIADYRWNIVPQSISQLLPSSSQECRALLYFSPWSHWKQLSLLSLMFCSIGLTCKLRRGISVPLLKTSLWECRVFQLQLARIRKRLTLEIGSCERATAHICTWFGAGGMTTTGHQAAGFIVGRCYRARNAITQRASSWQYGSKTQACKC